MPMLVALNHFLHGLDFLGSQARGHDTRTARMVVQLAPSLRSAPAVISGRRETRNSQCRIQRHHLVGALNRSKQNPLRATLWNAIEYQTCLRNSDQCDEDSHNRSKKSDTSMQLPVLYEQFCMIAADEVSGHDIGNAAVKPTPNRRVRDVQFGEKVWISRLADRFADPVVVVTPRERCRCNLEMSSSRAVQGLSGGTSA